MRRKNRAWAALAAGLLVLGAASLAQAGQGRLEEEEVNPSAVVFRDGQPYAYYNGEYERLKTRQQGGDTVYYRMVRYDDEYGYLDKDGTPAPRIASDAGSRSRAFLPEPGKYYGNGLYGPDYFHSRYNRDARQRYSGPGYFGSCDRYSGCRGVEYVPLYYYGY